MLYSPHYGPWNNGIHLYRWYVQSRDYWGGEKDGTVLIVQVKLQEEWKITGGDPVLGKAPVARGQLRRPRLAGGWATIHLDYAIDLLESGL